MLVDFLSLALFLTNNREKEFQRWNSEADSVLINVFNAIVLPFDWLIIWF